MPVDAPIESFPSGTFLVDTPNSPRTKANSIASVYLAKPFVLWLAFAAGLFIATITFNFALYWSLHSKGVVSTGLEAAVGAPGVYKNIVSIEVQFATYNRCLPWQTVHATFQRDLKLASAAAASGLILKKGLILTSSYVATDSYLVTVMRQGETRKFEAKVVAHASERDLALLSVEDEAFWQGVDVTVELDTAAEILGRGNQVVVAGFPVGEELSISKLSARVARVEADASGEESRYGSYPQTVLSLYPAIGKDVTVGPVFNESNNKLIGFIGTNERVVPVRTIAAFVEAYHKNHSNTGVGSLGMLFRPMRPLAMRTYWDLPTATKNGQQVGVQIRSVDPASPLVAKGVQKGDVLLAIDGEPVLANGAVNYRKSVDNMGRINDIALPFSVLLAEKAIGDEVKLSFRRATKSSKKGEGYKKIKDFEAVVKMQALEALAPRTLSQKTLERPTYFMLGGLVWTIFTEELVLQSQHMGGIQIPSATVADALHRWRKNPEEEVVVLLRSLEHPCNKWYGSGVVRILKFFNGKPVLNMKQFVSSVSTALKAKEELLKFSFGALDDDDTAGNKNDPDMVLDTAICAGADKDLLISNQVQSPVSPDLIDLYKNFPKEFTLIPPESHNNTPQEVTPVELPRSKHTPKESNMHKLPQGAIVEGQQMREMHQLPWPNVVQIMLTTVKRDFISPWKTGGAGGARCSAIITNKAKKMILTNSHCVGDTVALYVLREDVPIPVPAKVVEIAHDVDLAWITTDDESFWASEDILETVTFAQGLPYISHDVRVVGYPVGGSSISITQGIVSRIDAQTYPNGLMTSARNTPDPLLIVQIDAAINPGNSGGPVFDSQGHLVGLAFAGYQTLNSVGYVIPNTYLQNFVASIESKHFAHSRWKAQSELGAIFHRVENPGMRKFLRLKEDETGVQVRTISPESPIAGEGIVKGDVLIKIDGMSVSGSGKIERDFNGKSVTLPFTSVVTEKEHGQKTKLEFMHFDEATNEHTHKSVDAVFGPVAPLVPRFYDAPMSVKGREHFAAQPTYFILWGLVWGVFSNPVYEQARQAKKEVPWTVVKSALHRWRADDDEEVVVLLQGLGTACTLNYDTDTMRILQYFNGRKVNSMRDLARYAMEAESAQEAYMRITFVPLADVDSAGSAEDPDIVLHRSFCATADQEALQANNIPQQFSEDVYVHVHDALEELAKKNPAQNQPLLTPGSLMQSGSQETMVRSLNTIQHGEFLRATPLLVRDERVQEAPLSSKLLSAMAVGSTEGISTIEAALPAESITLDKGITEAESEASVESSTQVLPRGAQAKFIRASVLDEADAMADAEHSAPSAQGMTGLADGVDAESKGEGNSLLLAQLAQEHRQVQALHHLAHLRAHDVE